MNSAADSPVTVLLHHVRHVVEDVAPAVLHLVLLEVNRVTWTQVVSVREHPARGESSVNRGQVGANLMLFLSTVRDCCVPL